MEAWDVWTEIKNIFNRIVAFELDNFGQLFGTVGFRICAVNSSYVFNGYF